MKNQKNIYNKRSLFLILSLLSTSLVTLQTFKKVKIGDLKITGSEFFSPNDVLNNSSLRFPIRLIFIKTKLLEKELKKNLSLKNVAVKRQIFPFGLKVYLDTRTPIAYGETMINDKKILGFIDKDGIFISKQNTDEKNLVQPTIKVFGWKEKFQKVLSEIFIAIENYEFEIVKITFSPNGFLTIVEKDLRTIFLGFNSNIINHQLQIISELKNEFKKNTIPEKIDNIDLTDPNEPKIKVFKP